MEEKEENEIVNKEIDKNQNNNLKETKLPPNKEKDPHYKTTKSFNMLPTIQKSANETFRSSFDLPTQNHHSFSNLQLRISSEYPHLGLLNKLSRL